MGDILKAINCEEELQAKHRDKDHRCSHGFPEKNQLFTNILSGSARNEIHESLRKRCCVSANPE